MQKLNKHVLAYKSLQCKNAPRLTATSNHFSSSPPLLCSLTQQSLFNLFFEGCLNLQVGFYYCCASIIIPALHEIALDDTSWWDDTQQKKHVALDMSGHCNTILQSLLLDVGRHSKIASYFIKIPSENAFSHLARHDPQGNFSVS